MDSLNNQFGLKNNESGIIHDTQILLNELNLKLIRTIKNEEEFKNTTTRCEIAVKKEQDNLIINNRRRKANGQKRIFLCKQVK
jgi:hypothetical protein